MRHQLPIFTAITLSLTGTSALAQLEEVIVTAQKKQENLQDVSIAVSAFSEDTLRNAGIQNMTDITAMTPGFSISNYNPTTPAPYIRGVGRTPAASGTTPQLAYLSTRSTPAARGPMMPICSTWHG